MRFDDSLKTVLAADTSSAFGAQSAFRQIVDLMGRGRIAPDDEILDRLRTLRDQVPAAIRAASARALALAAPPAALVALFAEDDPMIAAPVLRIATLADGEWEKIVPAVGPAGRSVLRARKDVTPAVRRALESFGATDFTISYDAPRLKPVRVDQPSTPSSGPGPFVALGAVAREIPLVAEALRRSKASAPPRTGEAPRFEIAELVDRIENFQRDREGGAVPRDAPQAEATGFRFETDSIGTVVWVDGVVRGPVIGLSLAGGGEAAVDGVASGALRRRTEFRDARLAIGGASAAAGDWRISGAPMFDPASGRFLGIRGLARRPRTDERAGPPATPRAGAEALRRLVHELRTPTNAISGFAELIEGEMLGPVAPVYRDRAGEIRASAADLVAAIDDIDMAARIESGALELRPGVAPLAPMLTDARGSLAQLAALRQCTVEIGGDIDALVVASDDRATARLITRLMAALVSASGKRERIAVEARAADECVEIAFTRPSALATVSDDALFSIDAEQDTVGPGAPLLGTGFALRLARKLARELGGALTIGTERLTLRLPAGLNNGVQASNRWT